VVVWQAEKSRSNQVSTLDRFELFRRRQEFGLTFEVVVRRRIRRVPVPPKCAVASNAEKPVPKPASRWVKAIELFDCDQPNFLVHILGGDSVAPEQVKYEPEEIGDLPIIHRRPRGSVSPRHRPNQV
jgi:hypothetical protein